MTSSRLVVSARMALALTAVATLTVSCWMPPVAEKPTTMFTGAVPNAVVLVACDDRRVAVVAASIGARIDLIDTDTGVATSLLLPPGSNPWDVAVIAAIDGPRAIVSLYGDDALVLFDPCSTDPEVLQTSGRDTPIAVVDDREIDEMLPRTPQAVAVGHDDQGAAIWLAWTNIIAVAHGHDPMRTGPGLLTRLRLVNDRLVDDGSVVLPCKNPAALAVADQSDRGGVVVACSGVFKNGINGYERASRGAVVVVDSALDIVAAVDVDAAPASIVFHGGEIVVGDALDGTVARFDAALVEQQRTVKADGIATVFALDVVDGILVAGHFEDRLVADPFGTARSTSIVSGSTFRGIVDLAHDDDDVFALLSTSGELVRIDRHTVLGAAR